MATVPPSGSQPAGGCSFRGHGTRATYLAESCRCALCRLANRTYAPTRTRAIAMGRWGPYVDAEQAVHHLDLLRKHGYGIDTIAALSGVARSTVRRLLRDVGTDASRPRRIRPVIAQRLLAVDYGDTNVAARTLVDAAPTR